MVEEVLRLADRPVRTIMTHGRDIVWLDVADSVEDVRDKIADNGYSRFLVCDGSWTTVSATFARGRSSTGCSSRRRSTCDR